MSNETVEKALVLVVDDEPQIRRLLRASLEMSGYGVVEAATGQDGVEQAVRFQPDIMLLDLGLPDMDGNVVLKRFREWSQAPVMVVSVRRQEDDKIAALDNGANDYITKPFGTGELLARLRVMRRNAKAQSRPEVFQSGNLTVDTTLRAVRINGERVRLSATEYSLLLEFVGNAGKVLTHGHLLRKVWGIEEPGKIGLLRVYMGYLREKLETDSTRPRIILTEPGVGYRLVAAD